MSEVRAGAAVVDITPGVGLSMGGYGARTGVATGIHDPLMVRTAVMSDGTTTLVLAVCDLVGVSGELVDAARSLIERECGIPAANVCIAATHTHSGAAPSRDEGLAEFLAVTARKICGAVQMATRGMQTVTLKYAETEVATISQNRRHPDGPIETTGKILLAAPEGGAAPVATLVNFACHATVLEHDNLLYSADFPGAAARLVERALGGACVYMQGACGNINPIWMRHDFDEVERVGGILGAAAARTAHELRPLGEGQWAVNLNWSESTPKQPAPGTVLAEPRFAAALRKVDLPRRSLPELVEIEREIAELEAKLEVLASGDVAGRRALRPRYNQLRMDRAQKSQDPAAPGATKAIEIQAFRLSGDCAMIALPGEFFVETARELEQACGVKHLLICGYANDTIGYVAAAHEFPHAGYEVGRTKFAPESAAMVVEAAAALVGSLYWGET